TVPLQVINEQPRLAWRQLELRATALSDREQQQLVREQQELERASGFDYESGEVVHATLLRFSGERAALVLGVGGLCADAGSLQHMVRQLSVEYAEGAASGKQAEVMQYADFSEWQHELLEAEDKEVGRA